ncbi:spermidine synthase [Hoeflea olei]|uniref:Spermidine synthase n=1 Tax=Hoeflea olei TaxID=1480615 RepID=A0A1C1YYR5_9HYPH|nr:spermidine synthase [Hoeflea olei]OCW58559.1 spermidine synthase [Hoeflea olei]
MRLFEELDYRPTPIGPLVLRRRREARLDVDVIEIKLGEEHLMSDLFTVSEIALAELGLAACEGDALDVVVGGLGLGYTARAALAEPRTASLIVVEYLEAVLDWHRTGLLPLGPELTGDARCRLTEGDFFALARGTDGFDPETPGRRFDAILLDIDHSPDALLDARSESFYQPDGLRRLSAHLKPGGVFALWSDARPDPAFTERLASVFAEARAEPVTFPNPLTHQPFTQTVYVARKG